MKLKTAVACVVLVLAVVACGGNSDSRERNVGVSLAGSTCAKLGQVSKKSGSSYVCAAVKLKGAGAAAKNSGILYGVAAIKNWRCEKLGITRLQNGVFSVCSGGKEKKSRKWALTVALPANITTLVQPGETTQSGALEAVGVTPPPELVPAPGPNVPVNQQIASGDGTGAIVGTTTTSSLPQAFVVKQAPTAEPTPTTNAGVSTVAPTTPTTAVPSTTSSTAVEQTTLVPTTIAPESTNVTETPTTATTAAPTTTSSTTTTVASTTTAPTTTVPPNLTCAEGGVCKPGDTGPGGGIVVLNNFDPSIPGVLIEVAPITWFGSFVAANLYAEGLVYGRKSDWRLPTVLDLMSMRRDRAFFRCPGVKRCWRGFASSMYLAANENQGIKGVDFGGNTAGAQSITGSAYVRPVRTIIPLVGEIEVVPVLEPS